jgi:ketosteroid isomerase-like protein
MSRISRSWLASVRGVLVAMLFVWFPVCQPSSEAADVGSDRELCRRLWEGHLEAVQALQPEKVPFAKDAVLIYPDMPELRGDAIQTHLAKTFASLKIIEAGFKIERCEVVGGRAYTFVTVDELIQEGAAPPTRRHARCATVWEQQADKSWQMAHFLVNYRKPEPR